MSFLVADALTGRGRVFNLAEVAWATGELPAECGLFEASDVTRFADEHPGAMDVAALPVRPPLDAVWIESVFARFEHPITKTENPDDLLTYDRFGALVTCGEADDNGHRWVHIDGYGLCSQPPPNAPKLPPEVAPGVVHRLPFEGGYEIDDRGMLVCRGGGVSVAAYPRWGGEPDPELESEAVRRRRTYADGIDVEVDCLPEERGEVDKMIAEIRRLQRDSDDLTLKTMRLKAKTAGYEPDLLGLFDTGWRPTFEVVTTVVVQAVAAMNVRNTIREPLRASRQVRRQRERAGLVDPADVTVLKVPGSQRYAAGTGTGVDAATKAHHAVLGHFAYYGDTHPDGEPRGLLFGRQEGVFWHPPHWRGNREAGEVAHTYKITPPRL